MAAHGAGEVAKLLQNKKGLSVKYEFQINNEDNVLCVCARVNQLCSVVFLATLSTVNKMQPVSVSYKNRGNA